MSRWNEAYENHAYRLVWDTLRSTVEKQDVDDKSVETAVMELNRLKKVVAYVNALMEGLDVELVPLATWNQFQKQAQPCLDQINLFESDRNIAHIAAANDHADNLLAYIRPYMVLPEKAAASLKRAATKYIKISEKEMITHVNEASECLARIRREQEEAHAFRETSEEDATALETLRVEFLGDDDTDGVKGKIDDLVTKIESQHLEVSALHREALVGSAEKESLKDTLVSASEFAETTRAVLEKDVEGFSSELKELREFYDRAFGYEPDVGEHVPGIEDNLKELLVGLEEFDTKQRDKHEALVTQIEELLPGATTAGLASAYTEMKKSFSSQIKTMTIVFYVCIGTLVGVALHATVQKFATPEGWFVFKQYTDWQTTLRGLVSRLPLYGPAIWLGYFSSKRRSEAQRLQQEYAHKEAVAKSYISYKKQIEELAEESGELKAKLLSATIDTISHNASATLDGEHGDKSPTHEALEAFAKLADNKGIKDVFLKLMGNGSSTK